MKIHVTLEGQRLKDDDLVDITLTAEDDRILFEQGRTGFSLPVNALRDAINHLAPHGSHAPPPLVMEAALRDREVERRAQPTEDATP